VARRRDHKTLYTRSVVSNVIMQRRGNVRSYVTDVTADTIFARSFY
jgi:hypothetical protein